MGCADCLDHDARGLSTGLQADFEHGLPFFPHREYIDIAGKPSILSTWRCFCQRDREVDTFASDDQRCLRVLADGSLEGIGDWRHILDLQKKTLDVMLKGVICATQGRIPSALRHCSR